MKSGFVLIPSFPHKSYKDNSSCVLLSHPPKLTLELFSIIHTRSKERFSGGLKKLYVTLCFQQNRKEFLKEVIDNEMVALYNIYSCYCRSA